MVRLLFNLLLVFPLFSFCQSIEQKEKTATSQALYIVKAQTSLKNKDIGSALYAYGLVKRRDSTSNNGKISTRKIDSLKPIIRRKLMNEIQGVWKWKVSGTNWGIGSTAVESNVDRYLEINDSILSIYEIEKTSLKKTLLQKEKLQFSEVTEKYPYYLDFEYLNGQCWKYRLKDSGKTLHLIHTGDLTKKSRTVIDCGNLENEYSKVN